MKMQKQQMITAGVFGALRDLPIFLLYSLWSSDPVHRHYSSGTLHELHRKSYYRLLDKTTEQVAREQDRSRCFTPELLEAKIEAIPTSRKERCAKGLKDGFTGFEMNKQLEPSLIVASEESNIEYKPYTFKSVINHLILMSLKIKICHREWTFIKESGIDSQVSETRG